MLFKNCIGFPIRRGDKNQNNFYTSQETGLTRREVFYQAALRNKVRKDIEVKKIIVFN